MVFSEISTILVVFSVTTCEAGELDTVVVAAVLSELRLSVVLSVLEVADFSFSIDFLRDV